MMSDLRSFVGYDMSDPYTYMHIQSVDDQRLDLLLRGFV